MHGGLGKLALVAPLVAAMVLALAPSAEAYRLQPFKWGKRTLVYHNAATVYRDEVRAAARAWNRSGVRFRWKAGSRGRADVLIRIRRNLPMAGVAFSTWRNGLAFTSTIELRADIKRYMQSPAENRFTATAIIAHEMGHVMGLDHDDRRCATMNAVLHSSCRRPEEPWRHVCRVLQADDVRGAIRLYGGRARSLGPAVCDSVEPLPAPTELVVFQGDQGEVRLIWRMPLGAVRGVRVLRRSGSCPAGPDDRSATVVEYTQTTAGAVVQTFDQPPPGVWCYAVIPVGLLTRPGAAATILHEQIAQPGSRPPAADFDFAEDDPEDPRSIRFLDRSGDDGAVVSWEWDFGDGTTSGERDPLHRYEAGGTYTVTLTVTDDEGDTDSVTKIVEVADPPPPGA